MGAVMRYTMQDWKTEYEGRQLITGINCQPETVYGDFMTTKYLHHKTDGVMSYHMVQSFPKGVPVDPDTAHAAALKLAEYFEGHEVLVCTHTDRAHIHSHFIINSVNFDTGRKLHLEKQQLQELRRYNDQVCMQFSLPVFVPDHSSQKNRSMTIGEYHTAARGQSRKLQLMNMITDCMCHAVSREEFVALMESEGYGVRWEATRKNITYITPTGWKCSDDKLFGNKYLKEVMEYEFRIRRDIIYGRSDGAESSRTYETEPYTGTGETAADDAADHYSEHGAAGARRPTDSNAAVCSVETGYDAVEHQREGLGGRFAEADTERGATPDDARTGWEKERAEAFAAVQAAQIAPAEMGWAGGDFTGDGFDCGSLASAVVLVGRRLEQSQYTVPANDSVMHPGHIDRKRRKKLQEKRIALGNKEDDHEEYQGPSLSM